MDMRGETRTGEVPQGAEGELEDEVGLGWGGVGRGVLDLDVDVRQFLCDDVQHELHVSLVRAKTRHPFCRNLNNHQGQLVN